MRTLVCRCRRRRFAAFLHRCINDSKNKMDLTLDLVTQSLLASVLIVIIIIINSYCCWTALCVCAVCVFAVNSVHFAQRDGELAVSKKYIMFCTWVVSSASTRCTLPVISCSHITAPHSWIERTEMVFFCTALKTFRRPLTFFQFHPRFIIISKEIFSVSLPLSRRTIASETRTTTASTIFSHFRCFRFLFFCRSPWNSTIVRICTPPPPYANVEGS